MKHMLKGIAILAMTAASGSALGGVDDAVLTVGMGSGPLGSGTPVSISVDVAVTTQNFFYGAEISVTYDDSQLTPDFTNCGAAAGADGWSCQDFAAGVIKFVYFRIDGMFNPIAMESISLGTVDFDISGAAVDTYGLAIDSEEWTDSIGGILGTSGSVPGSLEVVGPTFSSDPVDTGTLSMSAIVNSGDPSDTLDITNIGPGGTSLDGSCVIGGTDAAKFYFVTDGSYAASPADGVEVACIDDAIGTFDDATLDCTSNDVNTPSVSYALECNITAGPQPQYGSSPGPGAAFNFSTTYEDEAPPAGQPLTINNDNGDDNTTLMSAGANCEITGTDPGAFSISPSTFSVAKGGSSVHTVSCTATATGSYSATLECNHNGSNTSPATYPLGCDIGPQRPGQFSASPTWGGPVIDITDGLDVVVDDPSPTTVITLYNLAPLGYKDVIVTCSIDSSGAVMNYAPSLNGTPISPQGSVPVTISVVTDNAGDPLTDTFRCSYDENPVAMEMAQADSPSGPNVIPEVTWDLSAVVREPESELEPSPVNGTPVTGEAEVGGSVTLSVSIDELFAEDVAASIDTCSVSGDGYSLITGGFPIDMTNPSNPVPILIEVDFTDPGTGPEGSPYAGTLDCDFTDSQVDGTQSWSWPLSVEVAGAAMFRVTKAFGGGYDEDTQVSLTCNQGTELYQPFTLADGEFVTFSNDNFVSGDMNCTVAEEDLSGDFVPLYDATGSDSTVEIDEDGCHFIGVESGDMNYCNIFNEAAAVDVVIHKVWESYGAEGIEVYPLYELTLYCDGMIVGGNQGLPKIEFADAPALIIQPLYWFKAFGGVGPDDFEAEVIPMDPQTNCWVEEKVFDDAVEVDNGCTDIEVKLGQGAECTITNTVFYEGIPTLSQWGMAIMALLMLGVGMVGFRRFT